TCFKSFSRLTTPSPARRAAPAWGLPYRNASLRCTGARSGSSRSLAKARHLPSGFRLLSSGRGSRQMGRRPLATPRRARNVCNSGITDTEREASQTRFHLNVRVETHEQTHLGGRGPTG